MMNTLNISSPSFKNGDILPDRHTGKKGISPELHIEGLSTECQSLAVMLEQKTSFGKPVPYWIIWNLPASNVIAEHIPAGAIVTSLDNAIQGVAKGINQYRGPKKNLLHLKEHKYTFTVYALDTKLDLLFSCEKHHLMDAIKNHILQQGELHFIF